MLKRETVMTGAPHPGTQLAVINTNAGAYLGFRDKNGMPYSRETLYMTKRAAEDLLQHFRK